MKYLKALGTGLRLVCGCLCHSAGVRALDNKTLETLYEGMGL